MVQELYGTVDFAKAYRQHNEGLVSNFGTKGADNAPIPDAPIPDAPIPDAPIPATRGVLRSRVRPLSSSATFQSSVSSNNVRAVPVTDTVSPMRSPEAAYHSPSSAAPVPLIMKMRFRRPTSPSATSGNGAGAAPGLLFLC